MFAYPVTQVITRRRQTRGLSGRSASTWKSLKIPKTLGFFITTWTIISNISRSHCFPRAFFARNASKRSLLTWAGRNIAENGTNSEVKAKHLPNAMIQTSRTQISNTSQSQTHSDPIDPYSANDLPYQKRPLFWLQHIAGGNGRRSKELVMAFCAQHLTTSVPRFELPDSIASAVMWSTKGNLHDQLSIHSWQTSESNWLKKRTLIPSIPQMFIPTIQDTQRTSYKNTSLQQVGGSRESSKLSVGTSFFSSFLGVGDLGRSWGLDVDGSSAAKAAIAWVKIKQPTGKHDEHYPPQV